MGRISVSLTAADAWITDTTCCTNCGAHVRDDGSDAPIVEACIDSDGVLQMTGRCWCGPDCQQATLRAEDT